MFLKDFSKSLVRRFFSGVEPVRNLVAIGNAPWAPCSHTKLWSKTEVKPFSPPTVSVGGLMLSPPKCISHILYFPKFAGVERENGGKGKKEKGEKM